MACLNVATLRLFWVFQCYICASVSTCREENKHSLMKKLNKFNTRAAEYLHHIKRERMSIHMRGYGIRLLISALVLMYKFQFITNH